MKFKKQLCKCSLWCFFFWLAYQGCGKYLNIFMYIKNKSSQGLAFTQILKRTIILDTNEIFHPLLKWFMANSIFAVCLMRLITSSNILIRQLLDRNYIIFKDGEEQITSYISRVIISYWCMFLHNMQGIYNSEVLHRSVMSSKPEASTCWLALT